MSDLEQVIQKQIRTCRKYVSPHNNPALVRSYEIEIKTLINAPRTERELAGAIRRVKAKMQLTIDTVDLEPLSSELEALEWLIPIVKKYSDEKIVRASSNLPVFTGGMLTADNTQKPNAFRPSPGRTLMARPETRSNTHDQMRTDPS